MSEISYSLALQVSVSVGCANHSVAVGLSTGKLLEEITIADQPKDFKEFSLELKLMKRNTPTYVGKTIKNQQ